MIRMLLGFLVTCSLALLDLLLTLSALLVLGWVAVAIWRGGR